MMNKILLALTIALVASVRAADFEIDLDIGAKPIKDVRESTCGPEIGYAGCFLQGVPPTSWHNEEYWFRDHAEETSGAMREAGAWFQRMWNANGWFAHRVPDTNPDPKKRYAQSHPEIAFKFWKDNGFKVLFTLEAWNDTAKTNILEFVNWIVDNDYKGVVAGFELGNESYYDKRYPELAPRWTEIVNEMTRLWPGVKIGINVAELFELNPDLEHVRERMLAAGAIKRDSYFAAATFNQNSAKFIVAMSNCIDKVTHVIYHAYGAETPYSCSYYGFQRFRNFCSAFPELKGKKFWLSEVRPRSDEDNRCQRQFRESLIMAHYSLMALAQPDFDGFNHHQILALSGGLYQSNGRSWQIQWRDAGGELPDFRAPAGRPRLDVGSCGVMYRILTEGVKTHPLVLAHGTSQAMNTEDAFFTSARVTDEVYARRRAIKEGREPPEVKGEVEWLALTDAKRNELCLLMVNTKSETQSVRLRAGGRRFAAPTYVTLSCPERYLDCREVPGDGKPWTQLSFEDSTLGCEVVRMAANEGLVPKCDFLDLEIGPHSVQSVTARLRK